MNAAARSIPKSRSSLRDAGPMLWSGLGDKSPGYCPKRRAQTTKPCTGARKRIDNAIFDRGNDRPCRPHPLTGVPWR